MITLELTEQEARNLRVYLGVHNTESVYDTYPVYEKLTDQMDGDLPIEQQVQTAMENYVYSVDKVRPNMSIDSQGLIVIKDER